MEEYWLQWRSKENPNWEFRIRCTDRESLLYRWSRMKRDTFEWRAVVVYDWNDPLEIVASD